MTFSQVWTYLRWPLAVIGLLLVAQYAIGNLGEAAGGMIEFDASGSILAPDDAASETEDPLDALPTAAPVSTLEPGTGPVVDGLGGAIADLHVNDTAADVDGEELVISDDADDKVVVAFDIPAGDPGCMAVVNLSITAVDVRSPVEIGVFASTVDDPVGVQDNQELTGDLRASATPMATALLEEPGTLTLDLTAGYQEYFTLGLPATQPLVLTIAPTVPVEPLGGVSFAASETGSEAAPTLLWTGIPDCGGTSAAPTES